jgi:isopenicillin N synthase-like dioxygenase
MSIGDSDAEIPRLDLHRFDAGEPQRAEFLAELRAAAHDVGFFYVTGHDVEVRLLRDLIVSARRFFALPDEDKLAIEMVNSPHFRGYNRVAAERTRGQPDWREQIDIGAERAAVPRGGGSPVWSRLRGPNQWPAALPELRSVVTCWQAAAMQVLVRILRAFALALGQSADALEPLYGDDPHYLVKLIRYPGRDVTAADQGVGAHKDAGLITLLLQDDQGGLQVETPRGWIDVPPRAGTFVINIGELLELASDGYLRATMHRVITPPAGVDRISAALFLGARLDATVPLLHLPPALATHARGPEQDPQNPLFRQVGLNYLKGRLRSHPDVARRHHADLIESAAASLPVLVLLPGLDGTGKLFTDFVQALAPAIDSQVVAYPKDEPLGYQDLELLVRAALPRDRPFMVLGESFSGPIAIRIAAQPPAGLVGVILCGTFAKNPYPLFGWAGPVAAWFPVKSLPRWVRAPLMWGSMSPDRAPGQLARAMADVSEAVIRRRIAALLAVDESEALARIQVPTLVLQARGDLVVPRSATQWIMEIAHHAQLVEIDGPHLLLQTRPAECAAAAMEFVRAVSRSEPAERR